jgi:hypothetical protein
MAVINANCQYLHLTAIEDMNNSENIIQVNFCINCLLFALFHVFGTICLHKSFFVYYDASRKELI